MKPSRAKYLIGIIRRSTNLFTASIITYPGLHFSLFISLRWGLRGVSLKASTGYGYTGGEPQEIKIEQPKIFKLYQAYPNPTTRTAVIRFQIPVKTPVSLKIYDISGRLIRTLLRAKGLELQGSLSG